MTAAVFLAAALLAVRRRAAPPSLAASPLAASPPPALRAPDGGQVVRPGGRPRRGGTDVTFLVTADTHAGFLDPIPTPDHPEGIGLEQMHARVIASMNGLPGTPWPAPLGGVVDRPRGVLVAGDLTEWGTAPQWERFVTMYGLDGTDGWVRYPVYEGIGNHDRWGGTYVQEQVARRHGAARYAWDWGDVHLVCLGEAPDDDDLAWLAGDLAAVGPEVGVVVFFHFPLASHGARDNWFGAGDSHHDALARVLEGYRVLGIFGGHAHVSGFYRWRGLDGYLEGSVKHAWHSFSVVRVSDARFTVASYNYDRRAFWWWHDKPIHGAPGQEASWVADGAPIFRKTER